MQIRKVTLTNFRNYNSTTANLVAGRNILIGDNAQGKTNFLEAIELFSTGKSERANQDLDLIKTDATTMRIEIDCEIGGASENIQIAMQRTAADIKVEKLFKLNGLTQGSIRSVKRRLVTVSFKSSDLNLLRGGPKFRRDWIDTILSVLKPMHDTALNKYAKVLSQRNRLLKQLFEKGRITVTDNDQLRVWDTQLAILGASIVKKRITLISELLPLAEKYQEFISGKKEILSVRYLFKISEPKEEHDDDNGTAYSVSRTNADSQSADINDLNAASEEEISELILKGLKALRYDEIRRKQTLLGPHRDDIQLNINDLNAVHFASQGQQRTLVLALKLAELKRINESLTETPVLLLDDVLAELDLNRQELLMEAVGDSLQTIITTTHVSGFKEEWLKDAQFLSVANGSIKIDI